MSAMKCEVVESLLPDWVNDTLDPGEREGVKEHLEGCASCREQEDFIRRIASARPEPPPELLERVRSAVEADRARPRVPVVARWVLAAAAMVILSLGTALIWDGEAPPLDPLDDLVMDPLAASVIADNTMIAGAPSLAGLSDEALEALLEELEG